MSGWRVGASLSPSTRNPDTLANQLANFAAMAMSHNVRVNLKLRGGESRTGRIVRREIRPELYEPDRAARWANQAEGVPRPVSSVVLHLDDGGEPLPLNWCLDIRSVRDG